MSAKILSSLSDDNRDFRKQVGCISIYKLFYRNNFPAGWRGGGHQQKRLPAPGTKILCQQNDPEKARVSSTGSSRASYSSSPYSSAEDPMPRQSETPSQRKKNNDIESQSQKSTTRHKQQQSSTKGLQSQSPDIRDVVKDSMHREARSLSIKFRTTDDSKVTLMKYVDSPRPLQQSKLRKPEAVTFYEGASAAPFHGKVQERIKISKHRSSFDECESRETMKLRELPRLSLDSRASALRNSLHMDMQVAGNHARSSSIIVKLMGLDDFPDTIPTPGNRTETTNVSRNFQERTQGKASVSQMVSQKNHTPSSSGLHHGGPTTCSKVPMESAPWKQQDWSQGSPRGAAAQSRKALAIAPHQSSSVYGEIEKKVTELEFRRSGKDLRALKQILESMQKTNGRLENQSLKSSEFMLHSNSTGKNPDLSIWENKKVYQKVPALKGARAQKPLVSSVGGGKKPNMKEKMIKASSTKVHSVDTIQELKYKSEHTAFRERPKDVIPRVPGLKLENCTTSGRGTEMASPRLQTNVLRGAFPTTTPSSDKGRAKKHSTKNVGEESSRSRRVGGFKSIDLQLSDDQLSELSNDSRCSSYQGDAASVKSEGNKTVASQIEREVLSCLANSIYINPRKQNSVTTSDESLQSHERETNVLEQPSPVSVLDNAFYNEGSPSPMDQYP